ncbi:MAG: HU family DNA-binding protein [Pelagibacteraceae bacterium]
MVNSKLITKLKQKFPNLKQSQIKVLITLIFDTISKSLIDNKSVELRKFGRWSVKNTKPKHNARNPKTGQKGIFIPSKKKVSFKLSKKLKEEINKN